MKTVSSRVFAVLLVVFLLCAMSVPVFADDLDTMNDKTFSLYKTFRNCIAMPLVILSFASCGFKILSAMFTGQSQDMTKIKKQILYTVMGLFALYFLPLIFGWAKGQLEATAWKPPAAIFPVFWR